MRINITRHQFRRHRLRQHLFAPLLVLVAMFLLLAVCVDADAPEDEATRQRSRGNNPQRSPPNIVLIVTDQERAPTAYENDDLKSFRSKLQGYRELGCVAADDDDDDDPSPSSVDSGKTSARPGCIKFNRHYTSSTACSPSRANLFTGQYSSIHGVRLTDGPRALPLDVPTMGHYFEAAGYETRYVGKWHLSDEDLDVYPTRALNGTIDSEKENEYLQRDHLSKYGFHGWIGPEPHGAAKANSGYWRDPHIVEQAVNFIRERNKSPTSAAKPFLLVVNLVNPHDICLWRAWRLFGYASDDGTVPPIPAPPTLHEDLSTKPTVQRGWKELGTNIFGGPHWDGDDNHDAHRRFYYYLHKLADEHVAKIVRALRESPSWDDTIFARTSDHGELLGAHGQLQKWYNAYDETLKVPFVVSSPRFEREDSPKTFDFPTSSVDVLPTILSLAGIDAHALTTKLSSQFPEAHPFVGEDLSNFIVSNERPEANPTAVYSATSDDISRSTLLSRGLFHHSHWVPNLISKLYPFDFDPVKGPTSIETVVAIIDGNVWKLVRCYDDPAHWSSPYQNHTDVQLTGVFAGRGKESARTESLKDEFELYDLTNDPYEENNLAHKEALESFGTSQEADRKKFRIQLVRTNLHREMGRLRKEKALQRNSPLPKMSSQSNSHLVDMWDRLTESFGMVGPMLMGALILTRIILNQEPVLAPLLVVGGFLTLTSALIIAMRIVHYVRREITLAKKMKEA